MKNEWKLQRENLSGFFFPPGHSFDILVRSFQLIVYFYFFIYRKAYFNSLLSLSLSKSSLSLSLILCTGSQAKYMSQQNSCQWLQWRGGSDGFKVLRWGSRGHGMKGYGRAFRKRVEERRDRGEAESTCYDPPARRSSASSDEGKKSGHLFSFTADPRS